jgi:hypothetical protein
MIGASKFGYNQHVFFMYLFMNINMNFERYIRETKSTKLILIYFF